MSSHYVCVQAGIVQGAFESIPPDGQKVAFAWEHVPALGAFQYVKWVAGNFDASKHSLAIRDRFFAELERWYEFLVDPSPTARLMSGFPRTSEMPLELPAIAAKPRPQYIELDGAKVSPEAWEFSGRNRLVESLKQGIDLAKKHFSPLDIQVCVEDDPEIAGLSYLVLTVQVPGSARDNVISHRSFAHAAAKLLGASREFIKLNLDLI